MAMASVLNDEVSQEHDDDVTTIMDGSHVAEQIVARNAISQKKGNRFPFRFDSHHFH